MQTSEILENYIYPNLNIEELLSELEPKDKRTHYNIRCPQCGKKEAYIPKKGILKPIIICNRKNKCAYISSIWNYIKERGKLSQKETLEMLANYSNTDLTLFSYQKNHYNKPLKKSITINYKRHFTQLPKGYQFIDNIQNIKNFRCFDIYTQFKTVLTFIYHFSLKTNQQAKINYYKSRKISYIPENIGFLSQNDIKTLENQLIELFPLSKLVEFNLFKGRNFKYNFSSYCIVPSFELSSNLVTALRFRNIYPSKLKEIEISNKRMLNPLSYGITFRHLQKYNEFYFTEGHIDALSMGIKNFVAIEGVNSFNYYHLGLFKNKKINLVFDMDKAGKEASLKFSKILTKLNISNKIITWDTKYAKDINELLQNTNQAFVKNLLTH